MKSEQIQKLLALSKSDNPNEAAVALKKAHALMDKYGYQEWQQILNSYQFDVDISPLIKRIEEVSKECGYADNEVYQKGLVDGIKSTLFHEKENRIKEEEYYAGFAVGEDITTDFLDGVDIQNEEYKV